MRIDSARPCRGRVLPLLVLAMLLGAGAEAGRAATVSYPGVVTGASFFEETGVPFESFPGSIFDDGSVRVGTPASLSITLDGVEALGCNAVSCGYGVQSHEVHLAAGPWVFSRPNLGPQPILFAVIDDSPGNAPYTDSISGLGEPGILPGGFRNPFSGFHGWALTASGSDLAPELLSATGPLVDHLFRGSQDTLTSREFLFPDTLSAFLPLAPIEMRIACSSNARATTACPSVNGLGPIRSTMVLTIAIVPEPSSGALLALGLGWLAVRRRAAPSAEDRSSTVSGLSAGSPG